MNGQHRFELAILWEHDNFPQNVCFAESRESAMAKVVALKGRVRTVSGNVLRKVPTRPKNLEFRSREYLLSDEVDALVVAAGKVGRHRLRDRVLILTS